MLVGERRDVLKRDLGVEAAGQHPLVLVDQLRRDVDICDLQARQLCLVRVALGVEPGLEQVDDLDAALVARAVLEQLGLTGSDGPLLHRALHHLQTSRDLVAVGGRAVAAEQELSDVGRDRVLAAELLREILLDEESVECIGGEGVEIVEFHQSLCPTVVG